MSSFSKMTGGFKEPSGVTDIYADVNGNLRNVVGADWAAIVLVENGRLRAFHLEHPEIEQEADLPAEKAAIARVMKSREPVIESARRLPLFDSMAAEAGTRCVAWLPLTWNGPVFAVLAVVMPRGQQVRDLDLLKQVAAWLAPAVRVASLQRDNEELRRRAREQDYLIDVVLQELKTAMTPVTASVSMLEECPGDQRPVKSASRGIASMNATLAHLTDLVRSRSGAMRLQVESCNVLPLVREAVAQLAPLSENRAQAVTVNVPPSLPSVRVDRNRFESIVFYLLSNAIELTPQGGAISVSAGITDGHLVVRIQDGGQPLPPGVCDQLSGSCFQREEADRRIMPGIGLGLAVARELVAAHGGTMRVMTGGNGGNLIEFSLPSGVKSTPGETHRNVRRQP